LTPRLSVMVVVGAGGLVDSAGAVEADGFGIGGDCVGEDVKRVGGVGGAGVVECKSAECDGRGGKIVGDGDGG